MPNWTKNILKVTGNDKKLEEFEHFVRGMPPVYKPDGTEINQPVSELALNFHSILPVPKALLKRRYGEDDKSFPKIDGCISGYDWQNKYWGTKWNAGDIEVYKDVNAITFKFSTPWSAPTPIYKSLAKQFPDLEFHAIVQYEDEGFSQDHHIEIVTDM